CELGTRGVAWRMSQHDPAIPPFGDALQGTVVVTAIPERDAPLSRQRVDAGVVNRMPVATEGDVRLGPERLHDRDLLFRSLAAIAEILVESLELDRVPADANAEPKAPARENVEAGRLLRNEHCLALRENEHFRREFDLLGRGAQEPEEHEGVVEVVGRGVALAPIGPARDIDAEHVIGSGQKVIAQILGGLREVAYHSRLATDVG